MKTKYYFEMDRGCGKVMAVNDVHGVYLATKESITKKDNLLLVYKEKPGEEKGFDIVFEKSELEKVG